MAHICLLLSGAALLLNGVAALDLLPRRDAAVFSLVIGGTQLVLGIAYLGSTGDGRGDAGGTPLLLGAAGMFLFGLTYVYVGLDFLLGLGSRGLGWFCGMVAVCGLLLAAAWAGADPLLAVLWLCWTYLWLLFFLQLALGFERLTPLIGWSLILTSQASATVPALLGITGHWPAGPEAAPSAAAGASVLAFLLLLAAAVVVPVESPLSGELKL
ncbi:AmiS/UreI family transporter [Arthrobacter sp. B10-11]|uniref:AmiS/UreI family transporter n=1 Tax=Arthrobacter sp. B10-11 TaxID=3081160 RepID=UPI0029554F6D|nr:AmiS/UreI family transporter [Arthrobacter sp. B10-11]MDV8149099.1 AmiS/UreI family transporter [Arthrobacter sp. B10-11]